MDDKFFVPAKVIIPKIWNSVNFIIIILAIPKNFYRFLAIIILELQLDKMLQYLSVTKLQTPKI